MLLHKKAATWTTKAKTKFGANVEKEGDREKKEIFWISHIRIRYYYWVAKGGLLLWLKQECCMMG